MRTQDQVDKFAGEARQVSGSSLSICSGGGLTVKGSLRGTSGGLHLDQAFFTGRIERQNVEAGAVVGILQAMLKASRLSSADMSMALTAEHMRTTSVRLGLAVT